MRHWIDGGGTDLANLVLLCRAHHHAHHDGEFRIAALGHGGFRFRRRDGRDLSRRISPAELADLDTPVEHEHPDIHPAAATTRWDGRRIDRDFAIAVLADRRRRARERAQLAG
ncbi:MAG: hypothetical protein QOH14_1104 [Pseudonocardiales bacterium]|nr:hypothetical protein [Pseudonocardiales bacterium]